MELKHLLVTLVIGGSMLVSSMARGSDDTLGLLSSSWQPEVAEALAKVIDAPRPQGAKPVVAFDFDNTVIYNDIGEQFVQWQLQTLAFADPAALWDGVGPDEGRCELIAAWNALTGQQVFDNTLVEGGGFACPGLMGPPCEETAPTPVAPEAAKALVAANPQAYQTFFCAAYGVYEARMESSIHDACAWLAKAMSGMTVAQIEAQTKVLLSEGLAAPLTASATTCGATAIPVLQGIRINEPIVELVTLLKARGFDVWIVSGSVKWLVDVVAAKIGVESDHVLAYTHQVGPDGTVGRTLVPPYTAEEGKVTALQTFAKAPPVMVFGDAETDIPMLAMATELAIIIDRGKEKLTAMAKKKGWLLQPRWHEPVSE